MRLQSADEQIPKIKNNKSHVKLSKRESMVKRVAFVFGIREVSGSNPGPQTDRPEEFEQYLQTNVTIVPQIRCKYFLEFK